MRALHATALTALLVFAGCSGDAGLTTTDGESTGELAGDGGAVGLATSDYVELIIASGQIRALASAPDLGGTTYRDGRVLFRRVDNEFLIGVFELTQAQWVNLGGSSVPYTSAPSAIVGAGSIGASHPAFGLSYDEIDAVLVAYSSANGITIDLPTRNQWRQACGAGGANYSWGNSEARSTVRNHALTFETGDGIPGTAAVGSFNANGRGIYDLHGNVWEWTAGGTQLVGGSWGDPTYTSRTSNTLTVEEAGVDEFAEYALFGARLVLRP